MTIDTAIREGQVLTGPLFNEPMRVETVRPNGPDSVEAGLVGQRTERFRRVTFDFSRPRGLDHRRCHLAL